MSFSHSRWQKEENASLVTDVLSCHSGNNPYTDGVGCTSVCAPSAWSPSRAREVQQQRQPEHSTGRGGCAECGESLLDKCTFSSERKTQNVFPNPYRKVA